MHLDLSADDLRPLVAEVVRQVIEATATAASNGKLGYTEAEAAEALGVPRHVLRDCRLRQEIHARKVGKRFVYSAAELRRFLETT